MTEVAIPNNNILIFTANPFPRSQATSEGFREQGAPGLIASKLGEVAIVPVVPPTANLYLRLSIIGYISALLSLILKRAINLGTSTYAYIAGFTSATKNIFIFPELVVGFGKSGNNETLVGKLQSLGFRREATGRQQYYRGQASQ